MKIATWNINSLRVRLPHVCAWLRSEQPDVLALQETKALDWLARLRAWVTDELARHPRLVVLGDFNVAPDACDVHDPAAWEGQVLFSAPERAAFRSLLEVGLHDSFRLFEQPPAEFS